MLISCPACGCPFGLEAGVDSADGRRLQALLAELHPLVGKPLIHYLAMFRPAKKILRWSRALKLAQELYVMIKTGSIKRKRTIYKVPVEAWGEALDIVISRVGSLDLPLKSHGYLLEILTSNAERLAAKVESKIEEQKRHISRPSRPTSQPDPGPVKMSEVAQKALAEMRVLRGIRPTVNPESSDEKS